MKCLQWLKPEHMDIKIKEDWKGVLVLAKEGN
jgi:hypothetical protein